MNAPTVPTAGRIVHYVTFNEEKLVVCRPAIVIVGWFDVTNQVMRATLNAALLRGDRPPGIKAVYAVRTGEAIWRTFEAIRQWEGSKEPHTWHWPEREEAKP